MCIQLARGHQASPTSSLFVYLDPTCSVCYVSLWGRVVCLAYIEQCINCCGCRQISCYFVVPVSIVGVGFVLRPIRRRYIPAGADRILICFSVRSDFSYWPALFLPSEINSNNNRPLHIYMYAHMYMCNSITTFAHVFKCVHSGGLSCKGSGQGCNLSLNALFWIARLRSKANDTNAWHDQLRIFMRSHFGLNG